MAVSTNRLHALIVAGGTGGHIFPGIAIAEELRALSPNARIVFAGTERGLETRILPRLGWPLMLFGSSSIKDRKGIARMLAWARVPFSIARAFLVLAAHRPSVLISIGGYAAGPLVVAAWLLRVPVALVEPNAIPGMTNRLLGRFAKRVFIAFEQAKQSFPEEKIVLSGVPIRREVLGLRKDASAQGKITVFVFGGSQGARRLNQAMVDAVPTLATMASRLRIIHQTGEHDDRLAIERSYAAAGIESEVFAFTDRIWESFARADIVVARAGANTVAELSVLGLPSILVPYPFAADDHQRANAEGLVKAGAAAMLLDADCTGERLARELVELIGNDQRRKEMASAAAAVARPQAAADIAASCLELVEQE